MVMPRSVVQSEDLASYPHMYRNAVYLFGNAGDSSLRCEDDHRSLARLIEAQGHTDDAILCQKPVGVLLPGLIGLFQPVVASTKYRGGGQREQ